MKTSILITLVVFTEHVVCPGPGALCVPSRQHREEAETADVTTGRGPFSSTPSLLPSHTPTVPPFPSFFLSSLFEFSQGNCLKLWTRCSESGPALESLLYKDRPLGHAQGIRPPLPPAHVLSISLLCLSFL